MPTKVIHIKDAPPNWKNNPDYVYVGRPSKWGNPFAMHSEADRDEVCEKFEMYLAGPGAALLDDLHELQGKTLVCYCHPKRCHADSLVEFVEAMED